MNNTKKQGRKFIVLARLSSEYAQQELEVTARNWDDAYKQVEDLGYTPFVKEYTPKPYTR